MHEPARSRSRFVYRGTWKVIVATWLAIVACGGRAHLAGHVEANVLALLTESFAGGTLNAHWTADVAAVMGAGVRLDNGEVRLTTPSTPDGKVSVRARLDATRVRGKRLRLVAKLRTDAPPSSLAHVGLTIAAGSRTPSYGEIGRSRTSNSVRQITLQAVVDVAADASSVEVALVLEGPGTAWFDDVALSVVGAAAPPQRIALTPRQIANAMTLARAVAFIRYLHPSDQAADADWDDFIARAIERGLHAGDRQALLETLRSVFLEIAPTVTFTSSADHEALRPPERGAGTHLARWRRYGPGTAGVFTTYREGRDVDTASAEWLVKVHVPNPLQCGTIRIGTTARVLEDTGTATLFVRRLGPGIASKDVTEAIGKVPRKVVVSAELAPETSDLELGFRLVGRSGVSLEGILLSCDEGTAPPLDFTHSTWTSRELSDLYQWHTEACAAGTCATLRRAALDTTFETARDMRVVDMGDGIRAQIPVAVWANDTKTFPADMMSPRRGDYAINDVPSRLATIVSAWAGISMLYPYFDDLHLDWLAVLPGALTAAAAAGSPADLHMALWHMLTKLRDNHVKVLHPAVPVDGILPIAFRRFAGKIIVIGGIPDYMTGVSAGDELVSLDDVPALQAYERETMRVAAATSGWREYVTPYRMGMGRSGIFRRLTIRSPEGTSSVLSVPLVPDAMYDHVARDPRPKLGAELAPGIVYVDFDRLSIDDWTKLLPGLQRAKGIIFDFRGYSGRTAFVALSSLSDRELRSPLWQVPVIGAIGLKRYQESSWSIHPTTPMLSAPVVALVDGRAVSAMETALQIFQVNRLGVLIGETSAGTNGNVGWLSLPGGFVVRFTGLRVSYEDGTSIQGHGVKPDQIVHPTVEGIRAGRDEILEAGLRRLQRPASP